MMMSAAFSAIMTVGAPVCPPGILGITEESAIRIPALERGKTTEVDEEIEIVLGDGDRGGVRGKGDSHKMS